MTSWEDIGPLLEAHRDNLLSSGEAARVEAFLAEAGGSKELAFEELAFEELYPEFSVPSLESACLAEDGRWRSVLRPVLAPADSALAPVALGRRPAGLRWAVLALAALFLGVIGLSLQEQPANPAPAPLVLGSGSGSGSGAAGEVALEAAASGDINVIVGVEASTGSGSGSE